MFWRYLLSFLVPHQPLDPSWVAQFFAEPVQVTSSTLAATYMKWRRPLASPVPCRPKLPSAARLGGRWGAAVTWQALLAQGTPVHGKTQSSNTHRRETHMAVQWVSYMQTGLGFFGCRTSGLRVGDVAVGRTSGDMDVIVMLCYSVVCQSG
jgi:hypothetical protein